MPQITLNRAQAIKLHDFCVTHKKESFFLAKDHGAYIGQCMQTEDGVVNDIHYFKGCNPKTDDGWYEQSHALFGGDDFGEFLPLSWLKTVKDRLDIKKITIVVGRTQVKCTYGR